MGDSEIRDVVVGNISVLEKAEGLSVAEVLVRLIFKGGGGDEASPIVEATVFIEGADSLSVRQLEHAALEAAADLLSPPGGIDPEALKAIHAVTRADEISAQMW